MNIDYTLWPNSDTELGKNKVAIPDGINITWPDGDALVGNIVFKNGLISGFVDTKALTVNESKSTVINYDYIDIELPFTEGEIAITRGPRSKYFNVRYNPINDDNVVITLKYKGCKTVDDVIAVDPDYKTNDIIDGVWSEDLPDLVTGSNDNREGLFEYCYELETFSANMPSLTNGYCIFYSCENLTSFTSNLSSLTDAEMMFYGCPFTSFSIDLPKLTNGSEMFSYCINLTSFTSNLSTLTNGYCMFDGCWGLTSFTSDLPSLTDGEYMFSGCSELTSFTSELPNLTNGQSMFSRCTNLTSFTSNLSSLTNGDGMFSRCMLDTASVQNIANTINTYNGKINIGIGNSTPNEQEEAAFNTMVDKGWIVYVGVNGAGSSSQWNPTSLIPIDGEETTNPIPFWAKPVQSDEEHAKYVDENGNFFIILGGNFIYGDDLSTYGMFISEEDAAANMRLTPYVKPVEKA